MIVNKNVSASTTRCTFIVVGGILLCGILFAAGFYHGRQSASCLVADPRKPTTFQEHLIPQVGRRTGVRAFDDVSGTPQDLNVGMDAGATRTNVPPPIMPEEFLEFPDLPYRNPKCDARMVALNGHLLPEHIEERLTPAQLEGLRRAKEREVIRSYPEYPWGDEPAGWG
jgi:hypothetical protein